MPSVDADRKLPQQLACLRAELDQAEDPRPYEASHGGVNPYPALLDPQNLYPGIAQYVVLNEIPLDQLQALPLNYGQRS